MRGLAAGRGANAPLHAPVIGQPRLISSSLQMGPDIIQGRSRQANQEGSQAVPPGNDPELAAQRVTEVCRRLRLLCFDELYQHLSTRK